MDMFKPGLLKLIFLVRAQQLLLKGMLLVKVEQILCSIPAVRIPGGLTPP
jgi:hypothetical protein